MCVCVCARVCARACVCACVFVRLIGFIFKKIHFGEGGGGAERMVEVEEGGQHDA